MKALSASVASGFGVMWSRPVAGSVARSFGRGTTGGLLPGSKLGWMTAGWEDGVWEVQATPRPSAVHSKRALGERFMEALFGEAGPEQDGSGPGTRPDGCIRTYSLLRGEVRLDRAAAFSWRTSGREED